ncbi:hypothetical protein SB659_18535 [Arthrobacter sp. SIMBA_036]|uniref:hypothetical protein n=1 Tax=Arthrobacter sp. SIMBA_036 TaxID=3085778 RepID=UPI00397E856F
MKFRTRSHFAWGAWIGAVSVSAVLLAGCAAAPGTAAQASGNPSIPPPTSSVSASAAAGSPSSPAKMICEDETRSNIVRILGLASTPRTTNTWKDRLYTCTYALPEGPFVLSVREAADPAAARAYFDQQQAVVRGTRIGGLANLGFPAFQTATSAVFVKDSFVLTVDASSLPAVVGPQQIANGAFAYQVATTVLACWSE